jgi:hypothetical protein
MSGIAWLTLAVNIAFWGLVGWGLRNIAQNRGPKPEQKTPEEVLMDRLKAGEIDQREYKQRLELLRGAQR